MEGQKNCSNPDGWSYNWTSEKISIKVDRGQLVEFMPIDDLINQDYYIDRQNTQLIYHFKISTGGQKKAPPPQN